MRPAARLSCLFVLCACSAVCLTFPCRSGSAHATKCHRIGSARRGISLAFITDTRPTTALSTFARDVDLLICESMYDDPEDLALAQANAHMLAQEAARLAHTAGAHALILTHFSPKITDVTMAEKAAQRIFANTRSARDGMIVTLDYTD